MRLFVLVLASRGASYCYSIVRYSYEYSQQQASLRTGIVPVQLDISMRTYEYSYKFLALHPSKEGDSLRSLYSFFLEGDNVFSLMLLASRFSTVQYLKRYYSYSTVYLQGLGEQKRTKYKTRTVLVRVRIYSTGTRTRTSTRTGPGCTVKYCTVPYVCTRRGRKDLRERSPHPHILPHPLVFTSACADMD